MYIYLYFPCVTKKTWMLQCYIVTIKIWKLFFFSFARFNDIHCKYEKHLSFIGTLLWPAYRMQADRPTDFSHRESIDSGVDALQGLTNAFRLEIKHPYLIVQNSDNLKDSIFHIYDVRNNELKCAFGSIGQGPKEYVMPWLLNNHLPEFIIANNSNTFQKFSIDKDGQATMKEKVTPAFQMALSEA